MSPRVERNERFLPLIFALSSVLVLACSDDDDDDDVPSEPFTAALSSAQEVPLPITGTRVRVSATNRAPAMGTFQSAVWVGFHDGGFDLHDPGMPASTFFPLSSALERLAEDGDADPLTDEFEAQAFGTTQGTLSGVLGPEPGVIAPGETVTRVFTLDPTATTSQFLSYASTILPSNDAFVANDDRTAFPIFDGTGNFVAGNFTVGGGAALDAGTEVNDEVPANTGFFGQTTPDTGTIEGGNVAVHAGFNAVGTGGILDDPMFAAADFTGVGYELLTFTIQELPAGPAPVGIANVFLASDGSSVTFTIAASGLSGPATDIHFHMAAPGVAGPVVIDLESTIDVNEDGNFLAEGSVAAPAGFADDLRNGLIYVNIHTALNPMGEIRGQIVDTEAFAGTLSTAAEVPAPVAGSGVRVTATNRAPELGTFQSPIWVGFHDGGFDVFDTGSAASTKFPTTDALEHLAEDGDVDPIAMEFTTQGFGSIQGTLAGILGPDVGPIAPGESVSAVFQLDPLSPESAFFSFATQVLPSNDAFLASSDPLVHPIFTAGAFAATDFVVGGAAALDAGTEVNDEFAMNTNFFGQAAPDTGTVEGGVVLIHPGFLAPGNGAILDDPQFADADFKAGGYEFLEFRFEQVAAGAPASGFVLAALDGTETQIDFTISAMNLSGPATAMHFHEGAPGVAGPVAIDLFDTITVNEGGVVGAQGSKPVTAPFVTALRAGNIYLNIHTALNPTGEIRAQLTVVP